MLNLLLMNGNEYICIYSIQHYSISHIISFTFRLEKLYAFLVHLRVKFLLL